jgi:hypothetical protein
LAAAAHFYPTPPGSSLEIKSHSAQGRTLIEIGIAPRADLRDFIKTAVVPALVAALRPPTWRD